MNIKFISYTGKYPNLCSGVLTVDIDGKEYKFGHDVNDYDFEKQCYRNEIPGRHFDEFWQSGGCIRKNKDWDMRAEHAPWEVNRYWNEVDNNHPQWIIDILPKLLKLFNENVSKGCCGGCI